MGCRAREGPGGARVKCPHCEKDSDKVVDSRSTGEGAEIRRRRECLECGRRYTTYERVKESPLLVVKKDQTRMPFIRKKIMDGLLRACEKRPIGIDVVEGICDRVEKRISEEYEREVPTSAIGAMVMAELRDLDQVAYVRFASVYRAFSDVSEFLDELRPLLGETASSGYGKDRLDPEEG